MDANLRLSLFDAYFYNNVQENLINIWPWRPKHEAVGWDGVDRFDEVSHSFLYSRVILTVISLHLMHFNV